MAEFGGGPTTECPRCGRPHREPEKVLCAHCRARLADGTGATEQSVSIQIAPILREALASVRAGEDIDEALLRCLKARFPEQAVGLLAAVTRLIDIEAGQKSEPRESVIRRLAEGLPGPELSLSFSDRRTESGLPGGFSRTVSETHVIRVGDKEYHSLEEAPPHIRRAIEEARTKVRTGRAVVSSGSGGPRLQAGLGRDGLKTGCSWSAIALVLSPILRLFGR